MSQNNIAIIGAGWAGLTAAIRLTEQGHKVTLFEASPYCGGRARDCSYQGQNLDNGQHLLIGAYTETLRLIQRLNQNQANPQGPKPELFNQGPFKLLNQHWNLTLSGNWWQLLWQLGFQKCSWADKLRLGYLGAKLRFKLYNKEQLKQNNTTVLAWLQANHQSPWLIRQFWEPLSVAALTTSMATASAYGWLTVLEESMFHPESQQRFQCYFPKFNLGQLLPSLAVQYLQQTYPKQFKLYTKTRIAQIHYQTNQKTAQSDPQADVISWRLQLQHALKHEATQRYQEAIQIYYDKLIIATNPHAAQLLLSNSTLPPEVRQELSNRQKMDNGQEPANCQELANYFANCKLASITTVYLGYEQAITLPYPMLLLDPELGPGSWLFSRADLGSEQAKVLAIIIAEDQAQTMILAHLLKQIQATCSSLNIKLPSTPSWHKIIKEKQAAVAYTPEFINAHRLQPQKLPKSKVAGLYLIGDYTYPHYPSTLEAAVRSGLLLGDSF